MFTSVSSNLHYVIRLFFCLLLLTVAPQKLSAATNTSNCIILTGFNPTIGQWWVSATFSVSNTCTTTQGVGGLQIGLNATQALNAAGFSLNSVSYPVWASTTATATQNGNGVVVALNTTATLPPNGQASGSFGYNPNGVLLTNLKLSVQGSVAPVPPTQPPSPPPSPPPTEGGSSGVLYFHAYVPQTSTTAFPDSMNLSQDQYTDLIMSNYIAGVLLGHMIIESFPEMQFYKDYLYGTIFAQLLQENIETELYSPESDLIDPSSLQAAVMGVGQGGPYQINNYAIDLVSGSYTPSGYSLVNYVAIQKNIGFTMGEQASQVTKATPTQFNNKYFGPVLTAYFHLNDLRALQTLENGSQGYISGAAPNFVECMNHLTSISNNPLDILINYAYNQGYYGGLLNTATTDCINDTPAQYLAKYNSYANAAGSSYNEYPYQVRFYLDEIYNQSTLSSNNHVMFNMDNLENVFSQVFQTLAYVNLNGEYDYISADNATTAFDQALATTNYLGSDTLDLSNDSDRAAIFTILETAIANLESNLKINFSATTTKDLTSGGSSGGTGGVVATPTCPSSAPVYPNGLGSYGGGTIVKSSNGYYYQCISDQVAPWCNSPQGDYYAPGTGYAWNSAWTLYGCQQ